MKRYFFVGIGGIGMSALAEYLVYSNNVAGSEIDSENSCLKNLIKKNIQILIEEKDDIVSFLENFNPDFIIITNTVKNDHIVIKYASKNNIKIVRRAELLANICNSKNLIGITGSHGKTSTTGLMAHLFLKAKKDPTIFVGGILSDINNNFNKGNSEYYIVEADDAYKSFLTLKPKTSIVTNISYEHLETYKDWNDILDTFLQYIENTKINGQIIINSDDDIMRNFGSKIKRDFITYGLSLERNNFSAQNIQLLPFESKFDLYIDKKFHSKIKLSIPGIHQIKNSLPVIATGLYENIDIKTITAALKNYYGVERRMQYVGKFYNIPIYDDYGHHPNELNVVFQTIKNMFLNKKIVVFFQPHKYTRTKNLWNEFIQVFEKYKENMEIFITDVYAAGDSFDDTYNSENMAKKIKELGVKSEYLKFNKGFESMYTVIERFNKLNDSNTVFLTLGAGVMDRFAKKIAINK